MGRSGVTRASGSGTINIFLPAGSPSSQGGGPGPVHLGRSVLLGFPVLSLASPPTGGEAELGAPPLLPTCHPRAFGKALLDRLGTRGNLLFLGASEAELTGLGSGSVVVLRIRVFFFY